MEDQSLSCPKRDSDKEMSDSENSEKNIEMDSDGSESPHSERSGSRSRSHSGSETEHSNREQPNSRSGSSGRGTPVSPNRAKTRSRSPSVDEAEKSANFDEAEDSRSQSPNLQIDDIPKSADNSNSEIETEAVQKELSKSPSRPPSRSTHSESNSEHSPSRSRSVSPNIDKQKASDNENQTESTHENDNKNMSETVNPEDIFGDADDISISGDEEKNRSSSGSPIAPLRRRSRSKSIASSRSRSRSNSAASNRSESRSRSQTPTGGHKAKENETEMVQETRIDVEIPRIVTDLGKEINFVKLPNFLSVEMRPFDTETYEDEIDEEETMDEEGRQRIKLKVSNTIRWREYMNNEGQMVKESNARFVRWSDGSQTLHLGNEMFDVYKQKLHGDHNHMFIRQGTGLQGQAVFRTKLTFRPHSTESFTHKKMTMSLADRSQKTSGIKILTQVGKDPTADRMYYLKKEEEKLRQAARSAHKPQPKKKKPMDARNDAGYQQDYGSDDENAVSVNAIKKQFKKGASGETVSAEQKASAIYSSDEDDSDIERRRKKINKTKIIRALRDSDSDDVASENADDKKADDNKTDSDDSKSD